jgi:hypothetical protein
MIDIFGSTAWYIMGLLIVAVIIIYLIYGYRKAKVQIQTHAK